MSKKIYLFSALLLMATLSLAACGGGAERVSQPTSPPTPAGDPVAGKKVFEGTCSACHGPEGKGVPGLGKDMTTSEFIAGKTDDELVAFIKVGRDPSDPLNTTGVAMPPKGGNPTFSDEDLYNVVAFIRTIHQ